MDKRRPGLFRTTTTFLADNRPDGENSNATSFPRGAWFLGVSAGNQRSEFSMHQDPGQYFSNQSPVLRAASVSERGFEIRNLMGPDEGVPNKTVSNVSYMKLWLAKW